ncbi:MAG TPA: hypothetical protein VG538_11985 [Vicinamibacterales bacterium]|nr:hypothetical protein [Vicinamibacterales bacterium]
MSCRRGVVYVATVLAVVVAMACGGDDDEGPTGPSLSIAAFEGTWTGTIASSAAGEGTLRVTLAKTSPAALQGDWSANFADASNAQSGTASGTLSDGGRFMLLSLARTPAPEPCAAPGQVDAGILILLATYQDGHLTATYSTLTCGGTVNGRIDLVKE